MTPEQLIREVQQDAAEWLEMAENPAELLAGILANKIIKMKSYISYLEKRVGDEYSSKNGISRDRAGHTGMACAEKD